MVLEENAITLVDCIVSNNTSDIIRKQRERLGFSQVYMAEELGITAAGYSRLERGETALTVERLKAIAKIFRVPVHNLIDGIIVDDPNKIESESRKTSDSTEDPYQKKYILHLEKMLEQKDEIIELLKRSQS